MFLKLRMAGRQRSPHQGCKGAPNGRQKSIEQANIIPAYALAHPGAVMVIPIDAHIAVMAMPGAAGAHNLTRHAVPISVSE